MINWGIIIDAILYIHQKEGVVFRTGYLKVEFACTVAPGGSDGRFGFGVENVHPEPAKMEEIEKESKGGKRKARREKKSARAQMCQGADQAWFASGM